MELISKLLSCGCTRKKRKTPRAGALQYLELDEDLVIVYDPKDYNP